MGSTMMYILAGLIGFALLGFSVTLYLMSDLPYKVDAFLDRVAKKFRDPR